MKIQQVHDYHLLLLLLLVVGLLPSQQLAFQVGPKIITTRQTTTRRRLAGFFFLFQQKQQQQQQRSRQSSSRLPPPTTTTTSTTQLHLSTEDAAKDNLRHVAMKLGNTEGIFIYDTESKQELDQAAKELEAVASSPSSIVDNDDDDYSFSSTFLGDWDLICTTTTTTTTTSSPTTMASTVTQLTENLPIIGQPLQNLRRTIQDSVQVQQRIRSTKTTKEEENEETTTTTTMIDRIDHVITVEPRNTLADLFGSTIPSVLADLDINPLDVSTAKITLIHKANVDKSTLRTKLTLESVVLSIAGTSQYLDSSGTDILGMNIPSVGDFLNSGTFDTTYLSKDLRISRGKTTTIVPGVEMDQLRVFVKKPPLATIVNKEEEIDTTTPTPTKEEPSMEEEEEDSFIVNGFDSTMMKDEVTTTTTPNDDASPTTTMTTTTTTTSSAQDDNIMNNEDNKDDDDDVGNNSDGGSDPPP